MKSIFGEQKQVERLIGEQLVRLVPLFELHRLVTDPQRAHLQSPEVAIRRRRGSRLRSQYRGEQQWVRYGDGCVLVVELELLFSEEFVPG